MRNSNAKSTNVEPTAEPRVTRAAAEKAHETVDRLASRAAVAETSVREVASASGEKLVEQKEQAQAKLDGALGDVNDFVRKNPLASTGIAFAAGALLTTMLRKS